MKHVRTPLLGWIGSCLVLCFSCQSPQTDKNRGQLPETGESLPAVSDPLIAKIVSDPGVLRIKAGQSAGILQLKMPSDSVFHLLGSADSTAAAMCKDLSAWHSESARLRIYSLCDNDLDMRKSVQVLAVCGVPFETAEGITAQSSLPEIRQHYPGTRLLGQIAPNAQSGYLAGDTTRGIAFALSDTTAAGRIQCVLIHLPGKSVTSTNIPFYPDLKM
ncbi:MAG: hypothetical protein FWJ85_00130 [Solitalea sp.]